ncbi:MAG: hypothetical protein JWO69_114 [Thermoleophilia bacterium]|nr:hypothetical protein [Thermoleophilia bacterium]
MPEYLIDIIAALMLAVMALLPGAAALMAVGLLLRLPPMLRVTGSVLTTVLLASVASVLQLGLHVRGSDMSVAWCAMTVLLVVAAAVRLHRAPQLRPWASLAASLRAHPAFALVLVLLAAIGFVFGGLIDGDALYHGMYAEKLASLPRPSFANTQLFIDGSPHAGYLAPGWHFLVAQSALLSGTSAIDVMRAGAAFVLPVAAIAFAALGRVVFQARVGAALGLVGFLGIDLLRPSGVPLLAAATSMWPGTVALWVAFPTVLAAWFLADRAAKAEVAAEARALRLLVAIATAALVLLHVTYVAWLAFAMVAWVLVDLGARGARRHHGFLTRMQPLFVVVGVALIVGLIYAALSALVLDGKDAVITGTGEDDRAFFESLLASPDHSRAASWVFASGGAAWMLGLVGSAALGLIVRTRAAVTLSVATVGAIIASQVEPIADLVAHTLGLSHVLRLPQVVPYELGLAALVLVAARALERAWQWCRPSGTSPLRVGAVAVATAVVIAALFAAFDAWPTMEGRFDDPTVSTTVGWVVLALTAALGVGAYASWLILNRRGDAATVAVHPPTRRAVVVASLLLLLAGSAVAIDAADGLRSRLAALDEPASTRDALGVFEPELVGWLEGAAPGEVVLAPVLPSKGIPVVAPLYVAAYPSIHTANTFRNRRDRRIGAARAFSFLNLTLERRLEILATTRATRVVAISANPPARFIVTRDDLFNDVHQVGDFTYARVDQRAVRAALAALPGQSRGSVE